MRVLINNYVLAEWIHNAGFHPDGTRMFTTSCGEFTINDESLYQVAQRVRAVGVEIFDRGNEHNIVTFSVSRRFTDSAKAEVFILEHRERVPRIGTAKFIGGLSGGAQVSRWLTNASVRIAQSSYLGVSTFHRYQIEGGRFLRKEPATT